MFKVESLQIIATEQQAPPLKQRKFKSARLVGEYEKPWTKEKELRKIWDKVIFFGFLIAGLGIGAYICYDGWRSVPHDNYCPLFEDDFTNGINPEHWNHEVELGGFGTGTFDWTTSDPRNSFTDSEGLHIVPTFTVDTTNITLAQINDGYVLNLTKTGGDGTCTSAKKIPGGDCSVRSNVTSGAIINPVRSARLTTRGKLNLTYGKIEVVAKLPKGDWLWPAIWMMPEKDVYGEWPASGEIDIMESKGNYGDDYDGGRDEISGTLHWGPKTVLDLFWKTTGKRGIRRTDYSKDFHVYGMEWTPNYIYTYVDSRLAQTLFVKFSTKMGNLWKRGGFQNMFVNGSALSDPWSQTGRPNTPFDEPFYLILNVAVGSTTGYFPDRQGDKPWINFSPTAMRDFWNARNSWMPTWGKGNELGMTVKSVKMWREGKC
ncbi:putative gram-negative bacteria binding protein [Mytilinidion resinicola]|uniref:Gram-negative bacteria binding protein n=1 Tax=Mytilinidion resinicola TaxID=574789 RepID=A0A6A6YHZ9_9PEZI|nr:putative gram-negative bacteria binding protein [Mytilinidion resinicola]KAF2808462.1 putative gram-negative bacteria binding protein [Mytilinidion resinicola]